MKPEVLVVVSDLALLGELVGALSREGFSVSVAMDGPRALTLGLCADVELIVLDLDVPGTHGFEVLEVWLGRSSVPVVVISTEHDLPTRLRAFELGAVDFLPRPFWIEELVARVYLRLGRLRHQPLRILRWADMELDLDARTVQRGPRRLCLTKHEFNVLAWLAQHPDRVVPRRELVVRALSEEADSQERTVDSHVSRIRRKLGSEAGAVVQTLWGQGYHFTTISSPSRKPARAPRCSTPVRGSDSERRRHAPRQHRQP